MQKPRAECRLQLTRCACFGLLFGRDTECVSDSHNGCISGSRVLAEKEEPLQIFINSSYPPFAIPYLHACSWTSTAPWTCSERSPVNQLSVQRESHASTDAWFQAKLADTHTHATLLVEIYLSFSCKIMISLFSMCVICQLWSTPYF